MPDTYRIINNVIRVGQYNTGVDSAETLSVISPWDESIVSERQKEVADAADLFINLRSKSEYDSEEGAVMYVPSSADLFHIPCRGLFARRDDYATSWATPIALSYVNHIRQKFHRENNGYWLTSEELMRSMRSETGPLMVDPYGHKLFEAYLR
jgi:hypothetical protein